ncbi:MAG: AIPR family protein [Acidobacteriota bacterium]
MNGILNQIRRDIQTDSFYQQNFANDGERFLAWYLRNIYLRTPVQARDDITDGANDKEIDGVIVDDEKRRVLVIQGKFYDQTAVDHAPLHEVLAAWLQIRNLPALQDNCNERLKVKLEAVAVALQDDYDVEFELVTTGRLTQSAQDDLKTFNDTISEFEHPEASIILVDEATLKARWDEAMAKDLPSLSHTFTLEPGKSLSLEVAHFKTVLAAIKLADCLQLPGIREGTLFRKNVRQALGLTNKVNKGLKQTINGENPQYFFLYHNGITALCEKLELVASTNQLVLNGLSIVNGCQSLNTILACSEKAKKAQDAYVLFRFYEIPQRDLADKISVNTNSQSAVKPRDLRSNDKRVLAMKRAYENTYRDGYFITKRGEERPADRDVNRTVDMALLAKLLMTWHCQRPNIAYNENKMFDKYFEQLFHSDYSPSDMLALHQWMRHIDRCWNDSLGLNQALMAAPSYSKFHLLFAIQACFCAASNQVDKVPAPSATEKVLNDPDSVITMAANCYNSALDAAISEYQEKNLMSGHILMRRVEMSD